MIYADTDFFLALLKPSEWHKQSALRLYKRFRGQLWTSPPAMIELLLLAAEYSIDPQRLLVDVLALAELRGGDPEPFLTAAGYMTMEGSNVFDSIHAAFCGTECSLISSNKVLDQLGLKRIPLGNDASAA